ncbi:hypothetical protein ACHAPU_011397 [Fusarium lateritium]
MQLLVISKTTEATTWTAQWMAYLPMARNDICLLSAPHASPSPIISMANPSPPDVSHRISQVPNDGRFSDLGLLDRIEYLENKDIQQDLLIKKLANKLAQQDHTHERGVADLEATQAEESDSELHHEQLVAELNRTKAAFRMMEATKDKLLQDVRDQAAAQLKALEDEKALMREGFQAQLARQSEGFIIQLAHMQQGLQDPNSQHTDSRS